MIWLKYLLISYQDVFLNLIFTYLYGTYDIIESLSYLCIIEFTVSYHPMIWLKSYIDPLLQDLVISFSTSTLCKTEFILY